jgi:hypothetical protein
MQDSSHLTIILYLSVIKIVISQKQKFNRKIIITRGRPAVEIRPFSLNL